MLPRHLVGDVHRPPTQRDHGHHVGAQRVAHHHEVRGVDPAPSKHGAIGLGILLAEDLDAQEEISESRASQFALLVEEVALGDEEHVIPAVQSLQGLFDAIEKLGRLHQHALAPAKDDVEIGGREACLGQLDRRLQHR